MRLLYQQAPALPLTVVQLVLPRTGTCLEPAHRQGVTRLSTRLLFMGAAGLDNATFNSRLERLGAAVGAGLSNDYVTFRLSTLTANLDAALGLFLSALHEPNFDAEEFQRLQAEVVSTWKADREETKRLRAQEAYIHRMYADRVHGYLPDGRLEGLQASTLEDVKAQYGRIFGGDAEPIVAVLSDLPADAVEQRVMRAMRLPPGTPDGAYPWDGFSPPEPRGRNVWLLPDADTNTDEVLLGTYSVAQTDPDWHIHRLIALIFGGDMNSRLFRIVRGERGLSYGANCWYESSQGRVPRNEPAPFSLYTFPSAECSAEAIPLMLSLYEELVEKGVTPEELERGRRSLVNAHPFSWDSPQKLLSLAVEHALYGLVVDDDDTHRRKMEAVTREDVKRVLRESHHPDRLNIVLLGDPARLEPIAQGLPQVEKVETIGYSLA